ncbi:MAG: hydroxymethylpyrimidine/phosphomethylpyrimidine kinase [Bacteroidales bacterium]|nr:hydroxymethylpyrimidine/phosphomethylpyrimidine kinase [Bacteroidales bacterium]
MKYFVSIAASDTSTGAGIQQDNRIAESLGFHALNIITAITSQSFNKVYEVFSLNDRLLVSQVNVIIENFHPLEVCKVGVLTSKEHIECISNLFSQNIFSIKVVDPVFRSSSGWQFLDLSLIPVFKEKILPFTTFLTPNKFEVECLCNKSLSSLSEAVEEAMQLHKKYHCGIYLKGGHFDSEDDQITEALIFDNQIELIRKKKENFVYMHGTGCAFSTAFACFLALYKDPILSATKATEWVSHFFKEINSKMEK